ncbi:MAG TPA: heavy-metal-associated domain-containing protein [Bacteroidota bacterium]|nr:heavy-metal-associated domain-containing protein [Bacteroidota bacterium]
MKTIELKIEGMHCGHCVMAVRKELSKLASVTVEDVQIGTAKLQIDETTVTSDQLAKAVEEAGYRVVSAE